jgi:hypothetical protein
MRVKAARKHVGEINPRNRQYPQMNERVSNIFQFRMSLMLPA